jgi:phosphoglycolate phosphatase-like HAD superfamily hydrolase
MKPNVFDIDGVLADNRHRFSFIEGPKKDWDAYYEGMPKDKILEPVAELLRGSSRPIVITTGRPDKYFGYTWRWFCHHSLDVWVSEVYTREDGDFRPNPEVKEEMAKRIFDEYGGINLAFEDDERSVAIWQKYADMVMHVKYGVQQR